MSGQETASTRAIVERYFSAVSSGDFATIEALLAADVRFWVPPSLPDGVIFDGREAVLRLFRESIPLYDADAGMDIRVRTMTVEAGRAAVEIEIRGKAAWDKRPYHNHYHFLFEVERDQIIAIREHMDSLYAYRTLFEPRGMLEAQDCPWLSEEEKARPRDTGRRDTE